MKKKMFYALSALLLCSACTTTPRNPFEEPARPAGQESVLKLACEPLDTVRVGFIGLGSRGKGAIERYVYLPDAKVVALCDLDSANVNKANEILTSHKLPVADIYVGEDVWKEMCGRDDIDLVYICTDWHSHAPMAVYAMKQGKHVAVEVPAAMTVAECWQLVDTAERTRRHCIMLENCCYDAFALTTLNMARQGLFGEIMHVEGAYIHDLRSMYFSDENQGGFHNHWNKAYCMEHTGNPYPTHGLGPVCQILNIHRGDRLNYLVSMSTHQAGMTEYARRTFGKESPEAQQAYLLGDMNTTLIHTVKGKTIQLQYCTVHPRPYSRSHTICGTRGFAQKYPVATISLEDVCSGEADSATTEELLQRYQHPFTATIGKEGARKGVPNEMNYIMDYRLIYCLHHGLPLDMDVYDAAEWSCITELSEQSVLNGSRPIEIPDFTRGAWEIFPCVAKN